MIATDLFELDKLNYLIVVDYFSRYIKVAAMQKTSKSLEVIEVIESNVHKTWNPRRSDNDPQYPSAEFTNFAKEWGFKHITSSPCFPQSNSEVERAVETIKSLLKKRKTHPRDFQDIDLPTCLWLFSIRTTNGTETQKHHPNLPRKS